MQKVDKLTLYFGRKSEYPGSSIPVNGATHYPIAYAKNAKEFSYLLQHIEGAELYGPGDALTMKGWERFQEIEERRPSSRNCFVAMWLDKSQDEIYENGIEKAVKKAGYQPVRIDEVEHLNKIDDLIIAEIRRSKFVVAEFTGHR